MIRTWGIAEQLRSKGNMTAPITLSDRVLGTGAAFTIAYVLIGDFLMVSHQCVLLTCTESLEM